MGLFLTISLIGYNPNYHTSSLGPIGADFAKAWSQATFGRFGVFSLCAVIFLTLIWWVTGKKFGLTRWIIGLLTVGFFIGCGGAFIESLHDVQNPDWANNGAIPSLIIEQAINYLKPLGTVIVAIVLLLTMLIILYDLRLTKIFEAFYKILNKLINYIRNYKTAPLELPETENEPYLTDTILNSSSEQYPASTQPDIPRELDIKIDNSINVDKSVNLDDGALKAPAGQRDLPPLSLLNLPPLDRHEVDDEELEDNSRRLEDKLASMRITAQVVKVNPGPIITRYDLEPAADVKIARIASLTDDIAMTLKARGVRIQAPIPGEAAVGIEIPNRHSQLVCIREIISSDIFRQAKAPLTIALGKDTNGGIFCVDLAKMPHLLIAGATGSGKSVFINAIIISSLYRSDPKDVRFVLIDPKKIELSLYARLIEQHLVFPPGLGEQVITKPDNAVKTLQSVHMEMERRYDILNEAGVRSLDEYNRWIEATPPIAEDETEQREHLPYLVVIIDELADLMMTVRREFEELVARLAQMARAVGIHLVVATQRPSVDVVTGLIKANFPARIAFRVATRVDSRTIIDSMGAEALLGKGDMLFMGLGSKVKRLHGALITTEEVEQVIEFVRSQPPVDSNFKLPDPELQVVKSISSDVDPSRTGTDEYFEEAAKIVVRTEQGSVSVLQRRLRVGYARAARLIDELEQAGIVGPFDGSKARQVMVTPEELQEIYGISV
ncbi:MAG: DNA translocase FtsK [Candidatus Hatepunaea meridiana]|nr:DNA translocase FtsK [Candidatus Hatepunaea meridiana]